MKYWDSSALVPMMVQEKQTAGVQEILARDHTIITWWGTEVECMSAITRLQRDGALNAKTAAEAVRRLKQFADAWNVVQPTGIVREAAKRLLRVHPLRAADALQLAAASVAAEQHPESLEFVCLDDRLNDAALKEGFHKLPA